MAEINLYIFTDLRINLQITEWQNVSAEKLVAPFSNGPQFNAAILLLSACYLGDIKQQINRLVSV